MKTASVLSVGLHVAVLAWAMISFNGKTFDVPPVEAMPVDMVSVEDFTKLAKGAKVEPKKEEPPKPLVEKKAEETKPPEEIKPKVTEKKEIAPAPEAAPPPPAETRPDPIADKIEKKPEQPKQEQVAKVDRLPPKRPPIPKPPKFDADKIAALLDKREAQRNAATGQELNSAPMLGTTQGNAARLSASELEALRARLMALWNPPVGIQNPEQFIIRVRLQLKPDGRLASPPTVLTSGRGQLFDSARDSAIRAVFRAQPFDMLRKETYDTWKDIEVTFDPRDMFRG